MYDYNNENPGWFRILKWVAWIALTFAAIDIIRQKFFS
jgi:hypothetical protein